MFNHFQPKPNSKETIPSKYSINLMWLNRWLTPGQPYISAAATKEDFITKVLDKVRGWRAANPEADIALWYDSQFVSVEAQKRTQDLIAELASSDANYQFELKDVRQIPIVRENPAVFSELIPLYGRIDLLKLIICVHSIEADGMESAIFSDLEIGDRHPDKKRLNKSELFNSAIMPRLLKYGIQLSARGDYGQCENQFIQILNQTIVIDVMKVCINANMHQLVTALNVFEDDPNATYDVYGAMFKAIHYYLLPMIEMLVTGQRIEVNTRHLGNSAVDKDEWVTYDPKQHGHVPFGNIYRQGLGQFYFVTFSEQEPKTSYCKTKFNTVRNIIGDYCDEFARNDLNVRSGGDHGLTEHNILDTVTIKKLSSQPKTNYTFRPWPLEPSSQKQYTFYRGK